MRRMTQTTSLGREVRSRQSASSNNTQTPSTPKEETTTLPFPINPHGRLPTCCKHQTSPVQGSDHYTLQTTLALGEEYLTSLLSLTGFLYGSSGASLVKYCIDSASR